MAVSVKMCIFNAIIFVILVQIVANSPYKNQIPTTKAESSLSSKNYVVSVKSKERVFEKMCDGYVISPKVVLSPAHCVYNFRNSSFFDKSELFVDYFHVNSTNFPYLENKQVDALVYPETFDVITMRDDIALLFLKEEITEAKPLEINTDKILDSIYYVDDEEVVLTEVLPKEDCGKFYRPASLLDGMMCVKDDEFSSSRAVFQNDKIAGFESWRNNVVDLTYPKVFTNIAHHANWINREMINNGEKDYGVIGILCYTLFTIWVAKRSIKTSDENPMGL